MHQPQPDWTALRRRMIDEQLRSRGIEDSRVLDAILAIPRERFLPDSIRAEAYEDRALPIGHDQTISQPYIVAYMTQQLALTPDCRVLEIGTGTGYQTAIVAALSKHVFTVERISALKERAEQTLRAEGITNVTYRLGDGTIGWEEHAPYDRILATAGSPTIPKPLVDQLADGGVFVVPVGSMSEQTLMRIVRRGDRTIESRTLPCRFVKLIGREGWEVDAGNGRSG